MLTAYLNWIQLENIKNPLRLYDLDRDIYLK